MAVVPREDLWCVHLISMKPTDYAAVAGCLAKVLSTKQEQLNGSFIAELIGDEDPDELMEHSATRFRRLPIQEITLERLHHEYYKNAKWADLKHLSEPCDLEEIDFFISHSWFDDPQQKFDALLKLKDEFEQEHNRSPTVWFAKLCTNQREQLEIDEDLKCLPFFITGCERLLVLLGDTYPDRLWCGEWAAMLGA